MRVYVYEAYKKTGGAYMAYQLGRICHEQFGAEIRIVGSPAKHASFRYPYRFPVISLQDMIRRIRSTDVFICNPSYSKHLFGVKISAQKLMYVQGISSFGVLDVFFDHYVSVSSFVQSVLRHIYQLDTEIIPPFIEQRTFFPKKPWEKRSDEVLVLDYKKQTLPLLQYFRAYHQKRYPQHRISFRLIERMPQRRLAEMFAEHKYYLTLTPMEGFGLPSLEAMASGCTVLGFDAFGGRDYFKNGKNAAVVPYGRFDLLSDQLYALTSNVNVSRDYAIAGSEMAKTFSKQRFDNSWTSFLRRHLFH